MTSLRYGVVVLARSDRGLAAATLCSLSELLRPPDEIALVMPRGRGHLFAGVETQAALPSRCRTVIASGFDTLPLADGFRALAAAVDLIAFVPAGIVLARHYLEEVRETAERWQDLVGEIDAVYGIVDGECLSGDAWAATTRVRSRLLHVLSAKSLCGNVLWVRVEACGGIKFAEFPQSSEYLAFSDVLDQLRPRGRTRVIPSGRAVRVRSVPERRSGFEAGRDLYRALERIGERRERGDANFDSPRTWLRPSAEKIRIIGEQVLRYLGAPASRAHIASFLRGMRAGRREAASVRRRMRDDIRKLG